MGSCFTIQPRPKLVMFCCVVFCLCHQLTPPYARGVFPYATHVEVLHTPPASAILRPWCFAYAEVDMTRLLLNTYTIVDNCEDPWALLAPSAFISSGQGIAHHLRATQQSCSRCCNSWRATSIASGRADFHGAFGVKGSRTSKLDDSGRAWRPYKDAETMLLKS